MKNTDLLANISFKYFQRKKVDFSNCTLILSCSHTLTLVYGCAGVFSLFLNTFSNFSTLGRITKEQ
jgi:hypothetical protein